MVSKTLPSSLGMLIVSTKNVLCMNYPQPPRVNFTAHPSIVKGPACWLMGETDSDPGEVCQVLLVLGLICFSSDLHLPPVCSSSKLLGPRKTPLTVTELVWLALVVSPPDPAARCHF